MSTEPLRALDEDALRLLVEGAGALAGDERLREDLASLRALGARVPALARVSEQLERASASGAEGLYTLAATAWQLAAARAQGPASAVAEEPSGPGAALAPVPPLGALGTTLSHAAARAALSALEGSAKEAPRALRAVAAQAPLSDVRLARPLVRALGSRSAALAGYLEREVLPAVGPELGPVLAQELVVTGGEADVRRLRTYVALVGATARPLLERAFAEGSAAVRTEALAQLGKADPPRGEALALEVLRGKKVASSLKSAALRALGFAKTDTALELLCSALDGKTSEHRGAAAEALATSPHKRAGEALRERLRDRDLKLKPPAYPRVPRRATPAQRKAANDAYRVRSREWHGERLRLHALLRALVLRGDAGDRASLDHAVACWGKLTDSAGLRSMLEVIATAKSPKLRALGEALLERPQTRIWLTATYLRKLLADDTLDTVALVAPYLRANKQGALPTNATALATTLSYALRSGARPADRARWAELLLPVVRAAPSRTHGLLVLLCGWRVPEARALAVQVVARTRAAGYATVTLLRLLKGYRAPGVAAAVVSALKGPRVRYVSLTAAQLLSSLRDPSVVPALRKVLARYTREKKHHGIVELRKALTKLEALWQAAQAKAAKPAGKKAATAKKPAGKKAATAKKPAGKAPVTSKKAPAKAATSKRTAKTTKTVAASKTIAKTTKAAATSKKAPAKATSKKPAASKRP